MQLARKCVAFGCVVLQQWRLLESVCSSPANKSQWCMPVVLANAFVWLGRDSSVCVSLLSCCSENLWKAETWGDVCKGWQYLMEEVQCKRNRHTQPCLLCLYIFSFCYSQRICICKSLLCFLIWSKHKLQFLKLLSKLPLNVQGVMKSRR